MLWIIKDRISDLFGLVDPDALIFSFHLFQTNDVLIEIASIGGLNDFHGFPVFRVHDPLDKEDGEARGDSQLFRYVLVCKRGFGRLEGLCEGDVQILFDHLQQRLFIEVFFADSLSNVNGKVIDRIGKGLVLQKSDPLD